MSAALIEAPELEGWDHAVTGKVRELYVPAGEDVSTAQEVLVRADAAMYAAKALGKGTFAVFDSRMPVRTWTELEAAG